MNTDGKETDFLRLELSALAVDLKRMLRVQLKEFVHTIEDVEFDQGQKLFTDVKHATINQDRISTHVA